MRLATFLDPTRNDGPRFGIVGATGMIDVIAAAAALHRAAPAASVKAALSGGAPTLAALKDLTAAAERAGLARA